MFKGLLSMPIRVYILLGTKIQTYFVIVRKSMCFYEKRLRVKEWGLTISLIFHFFNRKKRPIFGGALSIIIEGV